MKVKSSRNDSFAHSIRSRCVLVLFFLVPSLAVVMFLMMGYFDARTVRKQKQNHTESQFLQVTMSRLALEDRLTAVMSQQRFLMDHLLRDEQMSVGEIQLLLQSAIYNTTDVLGFSFVPQPGHATARPFSVFRSTQAGNDAREFARFLEEGFDFSAAVSNDPQLLSGRVNVTPHARMIALVEDAASKKGLKWYSIAILSLSPFLTRYVLPLAQGVRSDFFVIDAEGTVVEHKDGFFIGKNAGYLREEEGRPLRTAWEVARESYSGMENLESSTLDLVEPVRWSLTWNSVRVGTNRFFIGSYVPEEEINPVLTELRTQRYVLGGGVFLLLLLGSLVYVRIMSSSAARRGEQALQTIFGGIKTGVAVLDRAGAILFGNETLERMTGRPRDQLRMRTIFDLASPSTREQKEALHAAIGEGSDSLDLELLLSVNEADSPTNASFWASVALSPVETDAGRGRMLATVTDITGYKRAEHHLVRRVDDLEVAGKELSQLVAGQAAFLKMFARFAECELVEDLFQVLSEHLAPVMPFRGLTLYIRRSRDASSYEVIDTMGDVVEVDQKDFLEKRKGVLGRVAETGKPYLMGDASIDPYFIPHSPEVRSAVYAPILHKSFLWGAVILDSEKKHAFGVRERDLLSIVSSYLALNLEESSARQELGRKAMQLRFLHRVIQKIATERNNEELARRIVDVLFDELGFPGAGFYTPPGNGGSAPFLLAGRSSRESDNDSPNCDLEAGAAMRSRSYVERREDGKVFVLAIPIAFEGEVFGALAARHEKGFSESVHELLEITAEHMTTFWALNNLIAVRRHEALVDPLTQVWNRRYIMQRLDEENSRISRNRGKGAVVLVDLGDFKKINDRYGHMTGDEVLRKTSATMSKKLRDYDMIGRYGGDEFLIYLPDLSRPEAESVMFRMEEMVAEQAVDGYDGKVILDYGIAVCPGDGPNLTDAIRIADERMYRNKERRKAGNKG